MNERSGTLFSWSTIEFGCWVLILLFPVLYWVHGPAVSPDQWFVRTGLVVLAVAGAVGARLVRWHRTGRMRWRVSWGLLAALGVALALRVPYLTQRSIWYDEASSWQTASFGVGGVIDSLRLNVHLLLYYWLLQGWMALLGESVLALRSLSVALGLATVAGMYLAAREWQRWSGQHEGDGGSRLPAAVALLVAVNAFQINAAIEVRMYALGTALTALSLWALLRVLQAPDSRRRWAVYVGLCILLLYTHHHCLFVVASQWVYLSVYGLLQAGERARWVFRLSAATLVTAVAYVPGLLLLISQLGRVREDYWTAPLSTGLVARTFLEFVSPVTRLPDPEFWGALSLAAFGGAALMVARRGNRADWLALTLAILPMLVAGAIAWLIAPVWEGRYFRFSQLFLLLVLALAADSLGRGAAGRLALAALVLGMSVASIDLWRNRQIPARPGMAGAVERLLALHDGRAPIVATCKFQYFPAKYYLRDAATVRILRSATGQFWGSHLIRTHDVVSDEQFRRWLADGVWPLSHSPPPSGIEILRDAVVEQHFIFHYDAGVPPWAVHVSYVRVLDEEARLAAAIDQIRSGDVTHLDLSRLTAVEDSLRRLAGLDQLRHLRLDASAIEDQHLELLADCRGLESLSLIDTDIRGSGLSSLSGLANLRRLDLDFTAIDDRGLASVAALGNLRELSLAATRVTGAGLGHLHGLDQLESLVLDATAVGDQDVAVLAGLTRLAHLHVHDTTLGPAGAERLRQAVPGLQIYGAFSEQESDR